MQTKAIQFKADEFDDDLGVFRGYAAAFGNVDSGGDVILPGAFKKTLAERAHRVKIVWQHDWAEPIGKPLTMREDPVGLYVEGQLALGTQRGREAYELMKAGIIDELSIGYDVIQGEWAEVGEAEAFALKEIRLYEFSPVTMAMNERAIIAEVKADEPAIDEATEGDAAEAGPVEPPTSQIDLAELAKARLRLQLQQIQHRYGGYDA